jgi:hypothetical protein
MTKYENFEIVIEKFANPDTYKVSAPKACGRGYASDTFELEVGALNEVSPQKFHDTFSLGEIEATAALREEIQPSGNQSPERHVTVSMKQGKTYKVDLTKPLSERAAKIIGQRLTDAIFKSKIMGQWGRCSEVSRRNNARLRIRLNLKGAPDLAALPWEYMMMPDSSNFMGLDEDATIVRYLETNDAVGPLKVSPPLRILVMASAPEDLSQLDKDDEISKISQSLSALSGKLVDVVVLPQATSESLEQALREAKDNYRPFHVFHFIGHGSFEEEDGAGVLFLEDEAKQSVPVSHDVLGRWLQPYRSDLRLIFLNACQSARLSTQDPYSNVAGKIMEIAEVPAAIAMQFRITDEAAIDFAEAFYTELGKGRALEGAVDKGRRAINSNNGTKNEWATPVLYLRADSGYLLEVKTPTPPVSLKAHYASILPLLPLCRLVFFLGLNVNAVDRSLYESSWMPENGAPTIAELNSYLSRIHNINAPGGTLASIAQQLSLQKKNLPDEFSYVFSPGKAPSRMSKLYEVLAQLAKKVTDRLDPDMKDEAFRGLLFVTTTYDKALEEAFIRNGIKRFHIICYGQGGDKNTWLYSHRQYEEREVVKTTFLDDQNKPNEYTGWRDNAPIILKLPGEVGYDELQFAITEDDFFAFAKKLPHDLIPGSILAQIHGSRHLYLGYDMQNWTLRLLWDRICELQDGNNKKNSYAVVFDKDDDPNAIFWDNSEVKFALATLEDYVAGLEQDVLKRL